MSISRLMISGALAAVLAAPAMAQTYEFDFGRGFSLRWGSDRNRHHQPAHHSAQLRFDRSSARLSPGQSLHLHVERVHHGRVRKLTAGQVSVSVIRAAGHSHLRPQGDGFRFSADAPGRYILQASRGHDRSARMRIDVVAVARVTRIVLTNARTGRVLSGADLQLAPGALVDVKATPMSADGRRMHARVHFSLRDGGHLHDGGRNQVTLHADRHAHGHKSLIARVGRVSTELGFHVRHGVPRAATLRLEQILSCGSRVDAGSVIHIRRGSVMQLAASGRTRRGAPIAIRPTWVGGSAVAHIDGSGSSVQLHSGSRRGRVQLTLRDGISGLTRRLTVIVH